MITCLVLYFLQGYVAFLKALIMLRHDFKSAKVVHFVHTMVDPHAIYFNVSTCIRKMALINEA